MSSPSSSSNSGDSPVTPSEAVTAIVISIAGAVVIIVVVYLIVRCSLIRMRIRSSQTAPREEETSGTASARRSTTSIAMTMDSRLGTEPVEQFLKDILREKPIRFTPEDLINFTQNYSQVLGSGGFGIVYKGQFLNGLPMAVKVLKTITNKRAEQQFMAEVGTIGRTYHINLVKLYGFCFDNSVKALVYEYTENGSLDKYLFEEGSRKIEWGKLYEIAIGTGKGIRYLHEECQQKIVHYDIKPANVLLTGNFTPKVADFGLAKFCDRERSFATFTGARGTPGYAAPEMWMPIAVTHKCDVYSFGMLLFEILGRRRNLNLMSAEGDQSQVMEWFPRWAWERFEKGEMTSILKDCGIDEEDCEKAARVCQVALWCVQYQPEARPSMGRVVRMLEGEEEIVPPANPFQYLAPLAAFSVSSSVATTPSSTATDTSGGGSDKVHNGKGNSSGKVHSGTSKSSGNVDNETGESGGEASGNVDDGTRKPSGGGSREARKEAVVTPNPTHAAKKMAVPMSASPASPPPLPLPGFRPPFPAHSLFTPAPRAPTPPFSRFLTPTSAGTPTPTGADAQLQTAGRPSLFLGRPRLAPWHWRHRASHRHHDEEGV